MQPAIIDSGRGPEIAGSRITVYDVLAETGAGAAPERLATDWRLTVEQIRCALRYIDEHRAEVDRDWAEIQARHASQAEESARIYAERTAKHGHRHPEAWAELQRRKAAWEARNARDSDGREHRGPHGAAPVDLDKRGME